MEESVNAGQEQMASSEVNTPSENSVENGNDNADIRVAVDQSTGERFIELAESEGTENGPSADTISANEEGNQTANNEEQQVPQYYTDTELMQAFSNQSVDFSKISPQQQMFLQQQRDYQARQQQAEYQRQERQKQFEAQQMQQRQANFAKARTEARAAALKHLNITEDDLKNAEYMENGADTKAKFDEAYNNILANMQYQSIHQEVLQNQRIQQYQQGMMEIGKIIVDSQNNEQYHDEILKMMDTAYLDMPYREAAKYQQLGYNLQNGICTPNDVALARQYMEECKKIYYQQLKGVSTTPRQISVPRVERGGVPHVEQAQSVDVAKMRQMDQSGRDAYVQNLFRGIS